MTIKDGWLSWAERVHGPANKVYAQPNAGEGLALHSAEGWYAGMLGELMKPERQASWMFSNLLDGRFIQHYPITASTWASGNIAANTRLWAVESEGFAGTPLNASQVANMVRLGTEWEEHTGLKLVRNPDRNIGTLWEHGEVWNWSQPNAGPTACPSNRYLPFYEAWEANTGENAMTPQEKADFELLASRTFGADWRKRLDELKENEPLEKRMRNMEENGDTVARAGLADHRANHSIGVFSGTGTVTITGGKLDVRASDK